MLRVNLNLVLVATAKQTEILPSVYQCGQEINNISISNVQQNIINNNNFSLTNDTSDEEIGKVIFEIFCCYFYLLTILIIFFFRINISTRSTNKVWQLVLITGFTG